MRVSRPRWSRVVRSILLVTAAGLVAACGGSAAPSVTPAGNDQLAAILARGTLVVASDPAYPPQSFSRDDAVRTQNTRCTANQLTAGEMDGFDVQTAVYVAGQLGVEVCFTAPAWTEVTGGSWGDRWDISIGSMDISRDRMDVLYFAQPYYATPSHLWVNTSSSAQAPGDLDGARIGACLDCTQYAYLEGTLDLPGQTLEPAVASPEIVGYDVEGPGFADLIADNGAIEAFVASVSVGQPYVDAGDPIRAIDVPLFFGYSAPAIDRRSGKDPAAFVDRITSIIRALHEDGTLARLSEQYFGTDLASEAGAFDLGSIGQSVP